jgi:hypothetical protein
MKKLRTYSYTMIEYPELIQIVEINLYAKGLRFIH